MRSLESLRTEIAELESTNQQLTAELASVSSDMAATRDYFRTLIEELEDEVGTVRVSTEQTLSTISGQLRMQQLTYDQQLAEVQEQLADVNVQSQGFSEIAQKALDSVVSIITNTGRGSGVFFEDSYIVTNAHILEGATAGAIKTFDGEAHAIVNIVGVDEDNDLAVLQTDASYPPLLFGDSDRLSVGQRVIALGSPAGLDFTVTEGIISATSRLVNGASFIQHDVPTNPGSSGGPLIDSKMQIVGINTMKAKDSEGLGFAIPANRVRALVAQIMQAS